MHGCIGEMLWRGGRTSKAQAQSYTYGNLLELFLMAGHSECAEAVCEVLRKKQTSAAPFHS